MTANVSALIRKANVTPPAATSRPPSTGPMTKPRLSRLAHALLAGSIETNSANFSPRFEPADVCQPGKPPDLYMSNPGIYIAAEKL